MSITVCLGNFPCQLHIKIATIVAVRKLIHDGKMPDILVGQITLAKSGAYQDKEGVKHNKHGKGICPIDGPAYAHTGVTSTTPLKGQSDRFIRYRKIEDCRGIISGSGAFLSDFHGAVAEGLFSIYEETVRRVYRGNSQ